MIEVELRGVIERKKIQELLKNYPFRKTKERIVIMYFREKIPEDVREILNDPVDLRVKISKKQAKLSLKYGTFSDVGREELEINIPKSEVLKLIKMLAYLGWKHAVVYATEAWETEIDKITFTIVKILRTPFSFFEAEILVKNKKEVKKAEEKLKKFLEKFGLKPFTEEEFYDFCNRINGIEEFKFDFMKRKPEEIFKLFPSFL